MALRGPVVALLLGLLLAACAPNREALLLDVHRVPPDRLIAEVEAGATRMSSFAGKGSVAFEAPELSGSVFFSIVVQHPDSALMRFEGPFGIDVGFLFASRNRFVLYNAMENWYVNEPAGSSGLQSVLPFAIPFDQLMDALSGTFRLPAGRLPARYAIDDGRFLLMFPNGMDTTSYWVDPALRAVTQYRIAHGDSTAVLATTDSWTVEAGRVMPRRITMAFPGSARSVSVFYSSVTVNPDNVSLSHTVPPRARRRMLR